MDHGKLIEAVATPTGGKIVLVVADGLGGLPHPTTGLTELETARTPNLDALAAEGVTGLHVPIAPGISPGSGPAHMALFGYDPVRYLIGRGVLEALGIGFELKAGDVAARLNFATVDAHGRITDRRAGRISNEKCVELCSRLDAIELPGVRLFVRPVKEHRAVAVLRGDGLAGGLNDTDPQRTGVPPLPLTATDPGQRRTAELLTLFVERAREMLKAEPKANAVTLRGIAARDPIPTFGERYRMRAAAVAEYPMYRGVAGLVGMTVLDAAPPGEVAAAVGRAFADFDFFFVHFKKTDSTGEDGSFDAKVAATERLDALVPSLVALGPDVLVVTGDHSTPSALASHSWHPVPVVLRAKSARRDAVRAFGESQCLAGGLGTVRAVDLMPLMMAHAGRLLKFGA
ncbi:MAG: 2,3-bisphosphoglycerate-independent phosphoglycerate mutase [Candidatus Eisenbacteria bacterium]|nr:2,3-bisphosphoglycerate-independent phosphoglycerate mutase [Candidatus Eisenbacteria bacterium]